MCSTLPGEYLKKSIEVAQKSKCEITHITLLEVSTDRNPPS